MRGEASPLPIRRATAADAAEVARLFTVLGHPTTAEEAAARWAGFEAQGNSAFVAEREDGTLGGVITTHRTMVLHRPKPVGRITGLVVDEALRGRGVGRALVEAAELDLRGAGCGLLEVTSNLRRADAHAFYERLGYERTSLRLAKTIG
jgi:ribosomal protein S18 acetylase RimI-like enzyme